MAYAPMIDREIARETMRRGALWSVVRVAVAVFHRKKPLFVAMWTVKIQFPRKCHVFPRIQRRFGNQRRTLPQLFAGLGNRPIQGELRLNTDEFIGRGMRSVLDMAR